MTQTFDLPVDFAELSEDVPCEVCDETATHRVVWHACNRELVCTNHAKALAKRFLEERKHRRHCQCTLCCQILPPEEFAWIEPL